jgi:hypothetical protein
MHSHFCSAQNSIYMKLTYLMAGLTLAVFSLAACKNEEGTKETAATEQSETEAMLLNTQPASPTGLAGAQSASVAAQPAVAQTQKVTQGSTQAAKTAAGMNPAHGEPGHRCDIAVGAPLSSAPATPAVSKTITMPQTGASAAPATQVTPAAAKPAAATPGTGKVNPAHGQPGHDCAVPVGAPLKS